MRSWATMVAPGLCLLAFAAGCSESSASDPPSTPTLTHVATRTKTPTPRATFTPTKTRVLPTPTPRCPDPYASGVPHQPSSEGLIRLRPTGAPQPPEAFQPGALTPDPELERVVRDAIRGKEQHVSVVIKRLDDNKGVAVEDGRVYYSASLYKVWSLVEAFNQRQQGLLDFSEGYIVTPFYKGLGLNPGELETCQEVTFADAAARMMSVSDNVAANMVLDRVGPSNVTASLRGLGLRTAGFVNGSQPVTAIDMAWLLEAVYRGRVIDSAASGEIMQYLLSERINDRIPALLPAGTSVAHKTGNWDDATHDTGIVYSPRATYIIVVLTDYGFANTGADVIAHLSRAVYDYYNPP